MKTGATIIVAALVAQGALAGKPVPVPHGKGTPVTPPHVVDRSGQDKSCPPGFTFLGKQCVQQLTAPPEIRCPSGTVREGEQCAKYAAKLVECPPPYTKGSKGQCILHETEEAIYVCPDDAPPSGDGSKCERQIPTPPKEYCPPGSVPKGDNCVVEVEVEPELVCPPNAELIPGTKRCRSSVTYDCTPVRNPVVTRSFHGKGLRQLGAKKKAMPPPPSGKKGAPPPPPSKSVPLPPPGKGKFMKEKPVSRSKGQPDKNEEYVVEKICKRIHTEDARKICPKGGILKGKVCVAEELVQKEVRPGGFIVDVFPAKLVCPEGFGRPTESGSWGKHYGGRPLCVRVDEVAPDSYCPPGTLDVGSRCVNYQHLLVNCPSGFNLEGEVCTKTIYAPPVVEYTVKYQCTGKDCAH